MPASYLIVGGSSDIAILLAKRLLKDQHNVTVLARDIARCSEIQELGAEIIQGDALNPSAVSAAVDATQARGNGSIQESHIWLVHY
jgi:Trk K+ transport system NAD-binding subunit